MINNKLGGCMQVQQARRTIVLPTHAINLFLLKKKKEEEEEEEEWGGGNTSFIILDLSTFLQ